MRNVLNEDCITLRCKQGPCCHYCQKSKPDVRVCMIPKPVGVSDLTGVMLTAEVRTHMCDTCFRKESSASLPM